MKLLVIASSLDLRAPLSSTPSWWQFLKALSEQAVDLIVAPYQGPAIESPWWSAAQNPCQREGDLVGWFKSATVKSGARRHARSTGETASDRLTRALVDRITKPRWRAHLAHVCERHPDIDAALFLTVPPNHFVGIPSYLLNRFGVPTYLYDGDVPASLPNFAGFHSGFKIYQGADLSEYAGFFSSSVGGVADLERMGARNVRVLHYAADPALFAPIALDEDIDFFFYGHGAEYRAEWIDAMLTRPSQALPKACFAVRGTRLGDLGRVQTLPYLSFSKLREYACRSRVNLVITRHAHANVFGSSTARPFELAALGRPMVSNPYAGIEQWFEPGREIVVLQNDDEVVDVYEQLLRDNGARRQLGERARQRFLNCHTYAHRAAEFIEALGKDGISKAPGSGRPAHAGANYASSARL
jgi:glycosyl transferase family 1